MWKPLIANLCKDCKFHPPLSEGWIEQGLVDLEIVLNDSLKSFLLETDGLYDYRHFLWIVWNVRDLATYNNEMRNHQPFADNGYRFDDLLFIANSGTDGVLFGFPIVNNHLQENIIAWHPKTNHRIPKADNLEDYIKQWITNP